MGRATKARAKFTEVCDEYDGLFSAVNSAIVIDVQSKLESYPNEMTVTHIQILIHTVNALLFPDTIPDVTTWAGSLPDIVTVWSLFYPGLATSLFVAFLAMFGKQWVDRYLRSQETWWYCCRQKLSQATEIRRIGEVALPTCYRKPSGDASTRLLLSGCALSLYL